MTSPHFFQVFLCWSPVEWRENDWLKTASMWQPNNGFVPIENISCLVVWGRIAAACLLRWWGTRLISMKGATWQGPKHAHVGCWLFLRNLRLARDFPFSFLTTNMATIAGYVFKTHVIIFIYSLPPVLSDLLLTILHHKRRTTCSQFLSDELSSISKVVNHCHSSIHCRSPFGTTPLSLACHAKHIEAVEVIS